MCESGGDCSGHRSNPKTAVRGRLTVCLGCWWLRLGVGRVKASAGAGMVRLSAFRVPVVTGGRIYAWGRRVQA